MIDTGDSTIERYERNVSALERRIAGVARPRDIDEVVELVRAANANGTPLYPISTGRNWGLGSRLPVRDGAIVLDLGALDRIHAIDTRYGVAVIEPGVTQRQLAAALAGTRFRLDVTGSAADTSIIGNALDRGIAHDGPRADKLRVLDAVLGTGEHVAFDHAGTRGTVAQVYRWGLGPALHDLMFQSSYGIVTRAAIRLEPRTTDVAVLRVALADDRRLGALIDAARGLVDAHVLPASLHVSNRARSVSVLGGLLARTLDRAHARRIAEQRCAAPWTLACTLRGEPEMLGVIEQLARRAFAQLGTVDVARARDLPSGTDAETAALARAAVELFGHSLGEPSDGGLASLAFSIDARHEPGELDAGNAGTLFALPLVPMAGAEVEAALAIIDEVIGGHGLVPYVTLNGIGRIFELVLNVTFPRTAPTTAHAAIDRVLAQLTAAGYPPYRTGIQHVHLAASELGARVKRLLDPNGILAPGRY